MAPTAGTTAVAVAVEVAPGPAVDDMPQTPEGVLEDVLEESEEEPEMASEPVLEVVPEEVLVEGVMIVVHAVAPSPHGAAAASSPAPRVATTTGATVGVVVGPDVILRHPTSYALDNIPPKEVVIMAHMALSRVQCVLRQENEGLTDERRCLQLWATMLKEMIVSERAVAQARQHDFDLQVEDIT
jgi:hypothetical protein